MSEVVNIPQLRFPEFSSAWKTSELIDNLDYLSYGFTNPMPESNSGHYLLTARDIKNGKILYSTARKTTEIAYKSLLTKKSKPELDDILLTKDGTLGRLAIVDKVGVCINQSVAVLRPSENTSAKYLFYLLSSPKYQREMLSNAGGSTIKHIYITVVDKMKVKFTNLPEQVKIAEFLTTVDNKIEQLSKKQELLGEYKKGLMQQIFSQAIRFKADDGRDFPDWEEKEMGDIINFLSDYTANGSFASLKENVTYYSNLNYAVLVRTTDLEKKHFDPQRFTDQKGYEFLKKTSLFGGEIVMANVGSIGKVYRVPIYDHPMTLAPNTYVIKFDSYISESFIFQLMLRNNFKNKLLSMVGSSTLMAINKANLRSIKVEIPSLPEQEKIANFLSSIDNKIGQVSKQLDETKQFKKALLQQMFV